MVLRPLVAAIVCGLHAAGAATAQAATPTRLSLEAALARAGATGEEIELARAGVDQAEQEVRIARSAFLPTLSGALGYTRTLASQFSFDRSSLPPAPPSCAQYLPDPQAPIAERVALLERALGCSAADPLAELGSLPFGQANAWSIGLQASWNVFRGGLDVARLHAAREQEGSALVALDSARAQLMLDVTAAYFDALLAEQLAAIAEAALAQADKTLAQIELAAREGVSAEFDRVRARVARDNARPAVIDARTARDLAWARLRALLNLRADEAIELSTPLAIAEGDLAPDPGEDAIAAAGQLPRAPVRQAEHALSASEEALRAAGTLLPSLTLAGSYTKVAYPRGVVPSWDDFRTDVSVGARLEVPIFTGGRLAGERGVARAQAGAARARLRQVKELAALDSLSAIEGRRAAVARYQASEGTVEQARRALELAELRFGEGLSTLLELEDARLQLARAEGNRASALREVKVARVRLELLRRLPLRQP